MKKYKIRNLLNEPDIEVSLYPNARTIDIFGDPRYHICDKYWISQMYIPGYDLSRLTKNSILEKPLFMIYKYVTDCPELYFIEISEWVLTLSITSESERTVVFNNIVSIIWPRVSYDVFMNISTQSRRVTEKPIKYIPKEILNSELLIADDVLLNLRTYVGKYRKKLDLYYIFDQIPIGKLYKNVYYLVSGSLLLCKHPIITSSSGYREPNYICIKINNNIYITDTSVRFRDKDILRFTGEPDGLIEESKYVWSAQFKNGAIFDVREIASIIKTYPEDICIRDFKNIGNNNELVFFYKQCSNPNGIIITIRGRNRVIISMSNCIYENDSRYSRRFVIEILTRFAEKNKGSGRFVDNIKGELKLFDRELFNVRNKNVDSDIILYSRKIAHEKFPIVFPKGSKVLDQYIKDYKKKNNGEEPNMLEYKNFADPGRKNIYICPNKDYPNITFRSPNEHQNNICTVSCGVHGQNDPVLYKKCMSAVPFVLRSEDIDDNTNMYYIRQFTIYNRLAHKKLSRPPVILDKVLNKKTVVNGSQLMFGSSGYFIYGSISDSDLYATVSSVCPNIPAFKSDDKEEQWSFINHYYKHGINVIILKYSSTGMEISNLINYSCLADLLLSAKTIVILEIHYDNKVYYHNMVFIKSVKKKIYSNHFIFDKNDLIIQKISIIIKKLMTNQEQSFITLEDLLKVFPDAIQICESNTNIVYGVVCGRVSFPIIPNFIDIRRKYINDYDRSPDKDEQTQTKVISIINFIRGQTQKDIEISNYIGYDGRYIGFVLNNRFNIYFRETKKRKLMIDMKIINMSKKKYVTGNVDYLLNLEIYNMLIYHLSHIIQEQTELKNMIMSATDDDIVAIIHKIMDPRIHITQKLRLSGINYRSLCPREGSIFGQCHKDKLNVPEELYDDFIKLLAAELIHNSIRRAIVIDGNVSDIVNANLFTYQEGVVVEKKYRIE